MPGSGRLEAHTIARKRITRSLVKPRTNARSYSNSASSRTWNVPGLLGVVAGTVTVTLLASKLWNHQPAPIHPAKYANKQGMLVVC